MSQVAHFRFRRFSLSLKKVESKFRLSSFLNVLNMSNYCSSRSTRITILGVSVYVSVWSVVGPVSVCRWDRAFKWQFDTGVNNLGDRKTPIVY